MKAHATRHYNGANPVARHRATLIAPASPHAGRFVSTIERASTRIAN
jgi:hypothetical protein